MGFQNQEDGEVPDFSNLMLLAEVAEKEGENILNNSSGSTLVAGEENKTEDLVAADILGDLRIGNSTVVDTCLRLSVVPPNKGRISSVIEAEKESAAKGHVAPVTPISPMPAWMDTLIRWSWGTDVVLVLQKCLQKSDVDEGQSRFSIPRRLIANTFLTEKELEALQRNDRISVTLIQPCRETCIVELRKWNSATSFSYVLAKTWNNVVKNPRNELKKGVVVQLWAFRVLESLNFAMVRVEKSGQEDRK